MKNHIEKCKEDIKRINTEILKWKKSYATDSHDQRWLTSEEKTKQDKIFKMNYEAYRENINLLQNQILYILTDLIHYIKEPLKNDIEKFLKKKDEISEEWHIYKRFYDLSLKIFDMTNKSNDINCFGDIRKAKYYGQKYIELFDRKNDEIYEEIINKICEDDGADKNETF